MTRLNALLLSLIMTGLLVEMMLSSMLLLSLFMTGLLVGMVLWPALLSHVLLLLPLRPVLLTSLLSLVSHTPTLVRPSLALLLSLGRVALARRTHPRSRFPEHRQGVCSGSAVLAPLLTSRRHTSSTTRTLRCAVSFAGRHR